MYYSITMLLFFNLNQSSAIFFGYVSWEHLGFWQGNRVMPLYFQGFLVMKNLELSGYFKIVLSRPEIVMEINKTIKLFFTFLKCLFYQLKIPLCGYNPCKNKKIKMEIDWLKQNSTMIYINIWYIHCTVVLFFWGGGMYVYVCVICFLCVCVYGILGSP